MLATSQDRVRSGFLCFVGSLGLGYRTLPITDALRIHPAEVLLWSLAAYLLINRTRCQEPTPKLWLPLWLWLFMPFWIVGWAPSAQNWYAIDIRIAECRNFVLLVPLFLVVQTVLTSAAPWRIATLTLYYTSIWIASLGIVEYVFPGIRNLLPGFVSDPSAFLSADGFARARFSFWGGPHATFICVLAMPFALLLWRHWPARRAKVATIAGLALQIMAVYIGGYRSMWLLLFIQWLLLLLFTQRYLMGITVMAVALCGYEFMPRETRGRVDSLAMLLQGQPIDSSGLKRQNRSLEAFEMALENPTGSGWAAAGWVHSDFIQIAANLGVLAGLLFLVAYAYTLWNLWKRVHALRHEGAAATLGLALLLSFVAAGGMLAFEGVEVLPQIALPVWLIWAFAETWLRRSSLL